MNLIRGTSARQCVAVLATLLLSLSGAALAASPHARVVKDPKGDLSCGVHCIPGTSDLRAAWVTHTKRKISIAVRLWNDYPADRGAYPAINIYTGAGDALDFGIVSNGPDEPIAVHDAHGDGETVGKVKLTRRGARTAVYTFGRSAIGNPKRFRYRVLVAAGEDEIIDALPDRGTASHRLHR